MDKPHKISSVSYKLTDEAEKKAREAYKNNEVYEVTDEDRIKENVKIDAKFRTGVIVSTPIYPEGERVKYYVGQRVIIENGHQIPLDILTGKVGDENCPVLIRKMHVRGIINE